jgi:hypothetical protein
MENYLSEVPDENGTTANSEPDKEKIKTWVIFKLNKYKIKNENLKYIIGIYII